MKSIKEKRMLVKMAKALGQEPDPALVKEIAEYDRLVSEVDTVGNELQQFFSAIIPKESEIKYPIETLETVVEMAAELPEPVLVEDTAPPTLQEKAIQEITKSIKVEEGFQQPNPPLVDKNFDAIQYKLKFLEQAIGRIAAHGPGSGEVNFRWLDDVNRASINDNWVLEYDAATQKFQFTEDIGPIRTIKFNTEGSLTDLVPGQIAYNTDEDCLDIRHADGSTLQTGLETHMQVYNGTAGLLAGGTVVRFAGVNGDNDETPIVVPHIADGTIQPLYTVGVITTPIEAGGLGRATTFGKVRNVNTTGSDVSEEWVRGDILYLSPDTPGKLTKFKPTAPSIVVVIAAVLRVGVTDGILLVRPTIFPRLFYGTFSDTTTQTHTTINTPKAVTFNTTDIANGHRVGTITSQIIAENSGFYNYKFSIQLASSNSSAKDVFIWFRKNGVDIPNSATRKTITGNLVYDVAAWDISVSMEPEDYFEIMWAVTDTAVSIISPAATSFCPAIPSIILNVTEAAL